VEAATTTLEEKILSDREKRVVQLEYAFAALERQMDNHNSGVKVFDVNRLKSLKVRMNSYKAQIFEASRAMSPQVCSPKKIHALLHRPFPFFSALLLYVSNLNFPFSLPHGFRRNSRN